MGAYKRDVVVVIKMGAYIQEGAYFVWVPIIPILRYFESVMVAWFYVHTCRLHVCKGTQNMTVPNHNHAVVLETLCKKKAA